MKAPPPMSSAKHPAARERPSTKAVFTDDAAEEVSVVVRTVGSKVLSAGMFDGIGTGADVGVRVVGSDVG